MLRVVAGRTAGPLGSDDNTLRVWDAQSGELMMILVSVAPGETASLDPVNNSFLWASSAAWRHLGWHIFDPLSNRTRILPAEFRGPLPG